MRVVQRACCPIQICYGLDWRNQVEQALETIAKKALISPRECEMRVSLRTAQGLRINSAEVFDGNVTQEVFPFSIVLKPNTLTKPFCVRYDVDVDASCVVERVDASCVRYNVDVERLPQTFKEKKQSLSALTGRVQLRTKLYTVQCAFQGWRDAWHFSQRTLRQLAKEVVDDIASETFELQRANTCPLANHGKLAARRPKPQHPPELHLPRVNTWPFANRGRLASARGIARTLSDSSSVASEKPSASHFKRNTTSKLNGAPLTRCDLDYARQSARW